jgi:dihydrofolate synthase/folylpolyglutamate synthase
MSRLDAWLARLEARHPKAIDLGLERVAQVRDRLELRPICPVITVAGTNGKGSTCAYLHAMLSAAGYKTGLYTSPHLLRFNERVQIAESEADDASLVEALDAVEGARGDIGLSYFEHTTLAALWLFQRANLDALVLEVGLGGRLDAVNCIEPDCAVVTSIDIDHQEYLGNDRELIGREKAGIFRHGRPAICADPAPPTSLLRYADEIGARLYRLGTDIHISRHEQTWECRVVDSVYPALPRLAMPGARQHRNAAGAIAALWALRTRLPMPIATVRAGLAHASVPGRFQVIGQAPLRILDVAHNADAARALAETLADLPPTGRVYAVFGMLADKDIDAVVGILAGRVGHWDIAPLKSPRAADAGRLGAPMRRLGLEHDIHDDIVTAWGAACRRAGTADTIIAFGSFHTVAEIMTAPEQNG